jgi:tetratricopeptide (TPR) repeat protein
MSPLLCGDPTAVTNITPTGEPRSHPFPLDHFSPWFHTAMLSPPHHHRTPDTFGPRIALVGVLFWGMAGWVVSAQPPADSPPATGKTPAAKPKSPRDTGKAAPQTGGGKTENSAAEPAPPSPAESDEETPLPSLDQLPVPSFADLVKGPPVDWIVLNTRKVLIVEPVSPRPGAKEIIEERVKQALKNPETAGSSDAARAKRKALNYLPLVIAGEDDDDLRLDIKHIAEIRYWDDLLLQGVDQALVDGRIPEALQLYYLSRDRDPNWPGAEDRYRSILFEDGATKARAGRHEEALAAWDQLHARDPSHNRLTDEYGAACDVLIRTANDAEEFRRARYFLKRLRARYPDHTVASRWTSELTNRAADLVKQSQAETNRALALDSIERAARVWPALPQLQGAYQKAFERWPRLAVGLVAPSDLAVGAWPILDHHATTQLAEVPWFSPAKLSEGVCRFESRWFREWEPTDLGFRIDFHIRDPRATGVTAPWLATRLSERLRPGTPGYSERMGAAIGQISVDGPDRFGARLRLVPYRPEVLLATVAPPSSGEGPVTGETPPGPTRYRIEAAGEGVSLARRTAPPPAGSAFAGAPQEVVLKRFATHESALRALLRGELSMLGRIPLASVRDFQQRSEFFTLPYGIPETHVLTFNSNRPALGNVSLRRALFHTLPRQVLAEQVFGTADPALVRPVSTIVPSVSYAYDRTIPGPAADRTVGLSLAIAARKELGDNWPKLVLWHPRGEEPTTAAAAIVKAWNQIGITVQAVSEDDRPDPSDADIVYRRMAMVEPLVEFWSFLAGTDALGATSSSGAGQSGAALARMPVWLRRSLLELDTVGDRERAVVLLQRLQRQIHAEALLVPLWEIQPHYVVRKHVRGLAVGALGLFQGIDRWQVDPWYSPEGTAGSNEPK